ncbi:MAG: GNAT family N-acetyltransferase [Candidatus Rokubacteria bacterium]|nr:GNAT family N-acetyltransferase [Candidatus Rokubacteria bacterium]
MAFLVGERVYLRAVQQSDAGETYGGWLNDPEVTRYTESRFFPTTADKLREYVRALEGSRDSIFLAIVDRRTQQHVGNIKLGPIDWIHRLGDIGLLIGDKSVWGRGYATEAIRLVSDYAFRRLNLHKLTAGCYSTNLGSIRAFEKAGFHEEARRPRHYYSEGAYVDLVYLAAMNERERAECETETGPNRRNEAR